jgi:hypothetical protein
VDGIQATVEVGIMALAEVGTMGGVETHTWTVIKQDSTMDIIMEAITTVTITATIMVGTTMDMVTIVTNKTILIMDRENSQEPLAVIQPMVKLKEPRVKQAKQMKLIYHAKDWWDQLMVERLVRCLHLNQIVPLGLLR